MKISGKYGFIVVIIFLGPWGCKENTKLFTTMSNDHTFINFANTITETDEFNINTYLYAFNGGGVAIGDFDNDSLPDIYFTANQKSNKLYLNRGNFKFEDVTESAGVAGLIGKDHWTIGVTVVDINQDGWLDIYVNQVSDDTIFTGHNQLFVNNGDGTFTEKAEQYGLALKGYSQQAVFFDYDMDGDLDMYQLNHSVHELDVYVKAENRIKRDSLAGDRLFRNDGQRFNDVSETAGIFGGPMGYGLSVAVSDLDNNGCPDIYVSNDFHDNDYIYFNQCDGTFQEDVVGSMGHTSYFSMGSDIADINNDGLMDIMTLDMKPEDEVIRKSSAGTDPYNIYEYKKSFGFYEQYSGNMLQINQGNLFGKHTQFSERAQMAGVDATDWSWSVLLADFDNDCLKDIYITNGILRRPNDLDYINYTYNTAATEDKSTLELAQKMPGGKVKNYAYRNIGNLEFENVSKAWGLDFLGSSMGAAYVDLDNDGDLDVVVNNLNQPASIYKNNAEIVTRNNYLRVALRGSDKNRNGIGTKVEVHLKDTILTQELHPVRGWLSSSGMVLNFGMGKSDTASRVMVKWNDGKIQEVENITSNQTLALQHKDAVESYIQQKGVKKIFQKVLDTQIDFKHTEDGYTDFNIERLIPHKISTEGPKMAVSDVNGDQMDDLFIGGAVGETSALYFQTNENGKTSFVRSASPSFEPDKESEDVDAVFFDADADGDKDLYVVVGGGQLSGISSNRDRLYLNHGNGQFTKAVGLPDVEANGSCVVAGDFNSDGKEDLFIGTRSIPGSYGVSPDSYLLWNDGKGSFSLDTSNFAQPLKSLGMVTDAVWNEKEKQLVVVGEWMPITFLTFAGQKLQKSELPNSFGWWNTIHALDLDNDGDMDFLTGNLGENSMLKATIENPLKLLVKDWDGNGSIDPLLVYHKQEKDWLFNGLDELKKQIPKISRRYYNYNLFANHTLNQVFSEKDLISTPSKKAVILKSMIILNHGNFNYELKDLPRDVQMAPIYAFLADDFNSDGNIDILAAGNFYGNSTTLGRNDASYGSLLMGINNGDFSAIAPVESGFCVKGEVRDLKIIKAGKEKWILIGRNNREVSVYKKQSNNTPE